MHYFEDENLESTSEDMTSYVTVVNNCKPGHDAIDVTMMKRKPCTSLRQRIDDQLGDLSNYILSWKSLLCKLIWKNY